MVEQAVSGVPHAEVKFTIIEFTTINVESLYDLSMEPALTVGTLATMSGKNTKVLEKVVVIGDALTKTKEGELINFLNTYWDVFAKNLGELDYTSLTKMDISEVAGSTPVDKNPFCTSTSERRIIHGILEDWLKHSIISSSSSAFASPVVLVNKYLREQRL